MASANTGILLVAATDFELCGQPGLVCGVGPVEAALATANAIAEDRPQAVLHVGLAGSRGLTPGTVVVGTEAIYTDLAAAIPLVERSEPDPELLAVVQAALPGAVALPIATSASVSAAGHGPTHGFRVEGMEGFAVLRACELAGVPAVEIRAISNDMAEGDRALWMVRRGLEALEDAVPRLLETVRAAHQVTV